MDQILHVYEHTRVIGGGQEDEVACPEALGDDEAWVRRGHVVHLDVPHAEIGQFRGQNVRGVFGVSVDRGVGDDDGLLFGLVGCPVDVFVDEPADVLAPHGAMERADGFNFNCRGLFQKCLYLRAVFADDVGVVASCVVEPFGLEVHLVCVQVAVQRAEGAERVGGVERLRRHIVGHHRLRPVDHGRHDERERVPAGTQRVHLADDHGAGLDVEREEVFDHRERFLIADDLHIGVTQNEILHQRAVVGLHVVDDQIVERAAGEHVLDVFKENAAHRAVGGIQQHCLFIEQQIRVIAHAARDGVDVFK